MKENTQLVTQVDDPEYHKQEIYKSMREWPEGSKYTVDQKLEVLTHYMLTGNMRKTAKIVGISSKTLDYWKKNAPWWDEQLRQIQEENTAEFDAKCTKILQKTQDNLLDRVEKGDPHVLRDGTVIRKPIDSKSLATVMGITFDKQRIVRNLPTSISSSSQDAFAQVLNKLAEVGQNMHANTTKPAINVERVDEPKDKD